MRILLTNDDGVYAPGIAALARAFCAEHELYIAAPDAERSGASHALTLQAPLRARPVRLSGLEGVPAYAVNGSPVDCVKLAYGNLFPKPELVLSGINLGANRGTDIFYSGTVSAAMEGALLGVPSIAVSNIAHAPKHYEGAIAGVRYAMALFAREPRVLLYNVNAPDLPPEQIKGVRITAAGKQDYDAPYEERQDPSGRAYYWISSTRKKSYAPTADDDERWTTDGFVAITPLITNLTDTTALGRLQALAAADAFEI